MKTSQILWSSLLLLILVSCKNGDSLLPTDPQAAGFNWSTYVDTDIQFSSFKDGDHTLTARFLPQFPNAFDGPIIAENGSGTFALGQGNYDKGGNQTNLFVQIGSTYKSFPATLVAGNWYHLALVGKKSQANFTYTLYLNGNLLSSTLNVAVDDLPNGNIRLGKRTTAKTINTHNAQFFGLIDDVGVFDKSLSSQEIQTLAAGSYAFSGNESGLVAAIPFDGTSSLGVFQTNAQLKGAGKMVQVSKTHSNGGDLSAVPLPAKQHTMVLPFKRGEAWKVLQGYDTDGGSHNGYASFCWDFILAGKSVQDEYPKGTGGAPFYATASGELVTVDDSKSSPTGPSNIMEVKQGDEEYAAYIHIEQKSALKNVNDQAFKSQQLGLMGDVGANSEGNHHLHFAVNDMPDQTYGFVTYPIAFSNYELQTSTGGWIPVALGIPKVGQVIRRPLPKDLPYKMTAVWKPSTEGEIQVYGWGYDDFRAKYDEIWNDGWRLKQIRNHVINGQVKYTAVWKPSTEGEVQVYGWAYDDFRAKYDELWDEGWRLKLLETYVINGQVRYTAVWHPNTSGEIQVYGWKYDDYRAKYDELWNQGWRLHLLENYVVNGQVRYTAVWRPGNGGEIQVYNWKYNDYRAKYDQLWNDGWRLHTLNTYRVNGQTRYTAVWKPGGGGEIQVYEWDYQDYRVKYDELWEQGWRLHLIDVY